MNSIFGLAQNVLRPVKGQGISSFYNFWRVFAIWPNYGPADAASPLVPAPSTCTRVSSTREREHQAEKRVYLVGTALESTAHALCGPNVQHK